MSKAKSDVSTRIHATLVSLENNGILLLGPSASGKSDLALRFIMTPFPAHFSADKQDRYGELVADDQVCLTIKENILWGSAPDNLKGMIEVRHLGIRTIPYKAATPVTHAVMLKNYKELERYPDESLTYSPMQGVTLPLKYLDPFEPSAISKLFLACLNNGS